MAPADTITRLDAETYARDGVVVVRGVFAGWIDELRAGVERDLAEPGPDVRIYGGDEQGSGRFFGDYCNWQRIPEFRRFAFESPAAEIAAALLRSRSVRLFHEHVLVKEPGNDVPTPWHQDAPYYCVAGEQTISLWIPLDPVPRETTLEFVPGSHRWGKAFRPERFNRTALVEGDDREAVPDVEARARGARRRRLRARAGRRRRLQLPDAARRAGQHVALAPPPRVLAAPDGRRRALRRARGHDVAAVPRRAPAHGRRSSTCPSSRCSGRGPSGVPTGPRRPRRRTADHAGADQRGEDPAPRQRRTRTRASRRRRSRPRATARASSRRQRGRHGCERERRAEPARSRPGTWRGATASRGRTTRVARRRAG